MLESLKKIIEINNCKIRFYWLNGSDFELTDWANYFIFPTENYIEIPSLGPIEIYNLKRIEINPFEEKIIGRLIPPKKINHTKDLISALKENKIEFVFKEEMVKIEFDSTSSNW